MFHFDYSVEWQPTLSPPYFLPSLSFVSPSCTFFEAKTLSFYVLFFEANQFKTQRKPKQFPRSHPNNQQKKISFQTNWFLFFANVCKQQDFPEKLSQKADRGRERATLSAAFTKQLNEGEKTRNKMNCSTYKNSVIKKQTVEYLNMF